VYQELTTKKVCFVAKNGAPWQMRVHRMIFSEFLRLSADSLKKAVFDAGE
jgi:hypothetical protein